MGRCNNFLYVLRKRNYLILENKLFNNTIKIVLSTIIMVLVLLLLLEKYSNYLDYEYTLKSIYLFIIVGFAAIIYLILCYLLGLLNIKNYKTN